MKKGIALSLSAMMAVSAYAADSIETMFSEGKVSGQVRMFHIDRAYNGYVTTHRNATAIGGKLNYETASLNGLSVGAGFYTTNRIFRGLEKDAVDPTLFQTGLESYSILGEAYVKYDLSAMGTKTDFKFGRQKLDTPLAGSDDARMLPTLFEAYVAHNKDIENTTLALAHVTQIAPGSFANAYNGGVLGMTAGYTAVAGNTAAMQGGFTNMGEWAVGQKTDGVTAVAAIYAKDGLKVQAWDYYAHDILNAIYLQADMKYDAGSVKPFVAAQYINEDAVGNAYGVGGDFDSDFWGVKAGASVGAVTGYIAYSQQSDDGHTVTAWGGMPAFTQGMVTRHMFIAGTDAWKAAATYNFKDMGVNMTATAYYTSFDMSDNSGYGAARTATEPGFDVIYYPATVKNLQLRFRGNFPDKFAESAGDTAGWDEYRFIANYNF